MGRLPVTAAINIIKGVRENFGVELKPHNPCGLKGFYLTLEKPSQEITDYIVNAFKEMKAVVEVDEEQKTFVYKYYKIPIDSNYATTFDNASIERNNMQNN